MRALSKRVCREPWNEPLWCWFFMVTSFPHTSKIWMQCTVQNPCSPPSSPKWKNGAFHILQSISGNGFMTNLETGLHSCISKPCITFPSLKIKWFSPLVCIWVCISAIRKRPRPVKLFITTASVAVKLMCLAWLDGRLKLSWRTLVSVYRSACWQTSQCTSQMFSGASGGDPSFM